MTRYYTLVTRAMIPIVRGEDDSRMPEGLRLVAEIYSTSEWTIVQFEDDGAPDWMEGCVVTPSFAISFPSRQVLITGRVLEQSNQRSGQETPGEPWRSLESSPEMRKEPPELDRLPDA